MKKSSRKDKLTFPFILLVTFFCMYAKRSWFKIGAGNISTIVLTYKDGFKASGLIGTLYRLVNHILPIDMMSYEPYYFFNKYMCFVYLILAGLLLTLIYKRVDETNRDVAIDYLILAIIVFGGMFVTGDTMGSYDMYMMIVALISMMLIFSGKHELLVCILNIIGVLINPSYVFKIMPLILICWTYRWRVKGQDVYKKYIFVSMVLSALFWLASEASLLRLSQVYDQALEMGYKLSANPENYDVVFAARTLREASSILPEWSFHGNNYIDLLVLLLVASPYLLIGRHAFTDLINCVRNQENYKVYRLIQLGAVFILPEFILKIKYGYLVYEVVIYYLLILLFLIVERDELVLGQMRDVRTRVREKVPASALLLVYPLLLMPFSDVAIMNGLDVIARFFGA